MIIGIALIAALVAWFVIPRKTSGVEMSAPIATIADGSADYLRLGPEAAAREEKIVAAQQALRKRMERRFEKKVLDEVKDISGDND